MKILVVGSGGREHALVWKLRQSPSVEMLYCAPGNAGIAELAAVVPTKATDLTGLLAFAQQQRIDLTVVGPEQPLVMGIVDLFEQHGLKIFGPTKASAQLEGSKVFAKSFMQKYGIPSARYRSFARNERDEAVKFAAESAFPLVVKADGLAAGKGVLICENEAEAVDAVDEILVADTFGSSGDRIVLEEFLQGEEVSVFVVTDGQRFSVLAPAQDHKRALDGDRGKNTGGMGAYAPAPIVNDSLLDRAIHEVVEPTLAGMRAEASPYRGCLYCGLMITEEGPIVLEYNCRFGDPETQVVVPLYDGDFGSLLFSAANGRLDEPMLSPRSGSAVCVVAASGGYPDSYKTGMKIFGLDRLPDNVAVFHAGTTRSGEDIVTAGGRVLGVTAINSSSDLASAVEIAYDAIGRISFEGMQYRKDIGQRAIQRLRKTVA